MVYNREPSDRSEFGSLLDTLNQGASIEGLYNGFTHSSEYRKLETVNVGAKPEALQFFSSELAHTEVLLSAPTVFGEGAALPLATAVQPAAQPDSPAVSEVSFGQSPSPSPSGDRNGIQVGK